MMYDRELNYVRKKAQSWEIFVVLLQIPMVTYKYATEWDKLCVHVFSPRCSCICAIILSAFHQLGRACTPKW